jgi:hypothetical protein
VKPEQAALVTLAQKEKEEVGRKKSRKDEEVKK